eukprot:XP_015577639.2 uncharacterized protein LOC8271939 [Ricinus communis]
MKMEFKKLGLRFFLLVILLLPLPHLPLLHAHPFNTTTAFQEEPNAADKEMQRNLTVIIGLKRLISVNRKGGGGHGRGGHAGGQGDRAISGGQSGNNDGAYKNGATVVPLYAATGARGHHHGTNEGTHKYAGSSFWVLAVLLVSFVQYFA